MRCSFCGAELAEGMPVCEKCGNKVKKMNDEDAFSLLKAGLGNVETMEEERIGRRGEAVQPLRMMRNARLAGLIIAALEILAFAGLMFVLFRGLNDIWFWATYTDDTWYQLFRLILIGAIVAAVIPKLFFVAGLLKLRRADSTINAVAVLAILELGLFLAMQLVDADIPNLIISIVSCVVSIVFMVKYCHAIERLCRPDLQDDAENWRRLLSVFIAAEVISAAIAPIAAALIFGDLYFVTIKTLIWMKILLEGLPIVCSLIILIMEIRYLGSTADSLAKATEGKR